MNTAPLLYEKSVFINCPFDPKYKPKLRAIVFTVVACGFTPRCALEFNDGNDVRIQKIMDIIAECQYGIHDISIPERRMNMPLELGLFIGGRRYGNERQQQKRYIILEGKTLSSKKYLSDLAGQDPFPHNNRIANLIQGIWEWLHNKSDDPDAIPDGPYLVRAFKKLERELPGICATKKRTPSKLTFTGYLSILSSWIGRELYELP